MNPACPNCGATLQPCPGPAQDAPWLCTVCAHGWWNAEITNTAAESWHRSTRSFGTHPSADTIRADVETEQAAARARGSNRGTP